MYERPRELYVTKMFVRIILNNIFLNILKKLFFVDLSAIIILS